MTKSIAIKSVPKQKRLYTKSSYQTKERQCYCANVQFDISHIVIYNLHIMK